ncbi:MAG: hypothetical protein AMS27_14970 [Bacteroides sp. SM23_62_1]|nr:MAG: hypothetical protein AMS27_14970 [Bacteroides sp. SM23_62_1]
MSDIGNNVSESKFETRRFEEKSKIETSRFKIELKFETWKFGTNMIKGTMKSSNYFMMADSKLAVHFSF